MDFLKRFIVLGILIITFSVKANNNMPTQMIISSKPTNIIIMFRNYDRYDTYRNDRAFMIKFHWKKEFIYQGESND